MHKMKWVAAGFAAAFAIASVLCLRLYTEAHTIIKRLPVMLYSDSCAAPADSLLVHWTFDEARGHLTGNQGGLGGDGFLGSQFDTHRRFFPIPQKMRNFALPDHVEGKAGKALEFTGFNWVHGGNSNCFNTDTFTIALWAWKSKTWPEGEKWFVPTMAAKSNWPGNGWWLCTRPNSSELDMAISWGEKRLHVHSGYMIVPEEWHHYAVTMDNVNHEVQFFVDGVPMGAKHTDVPTWLVNWDQNLYVGDYDGSGRWGWYGRIDDFRYYNKIVSPEEIQAVYALAGKGIGPPKSGKIVDLGSDPAAK